LDDADQHDFLAFDRAGFAQSFFTASRVFSFDASAVGFEDLAVGFVGAQGLLVGKKEVAA
jgi:hypothetical protein